MSKCAISFKSKDNPNVRERTHQSFAKDANINNIMAKYKKTGVFVDSLKSNPYRQPNFADYSDVGDFQSVMDAVISAQNDFLRLPIATRVKFDHNVANAIAFLSNPENLVASIDLGLLPEELRPKKENVDPKAVGPAQPATA